MALFLLKPILWNPNGYLRPSGVAVQSGFPKENGFGFEEWNNSPKLQWTQHDCRFRALYTEQVGNAPLEENVGQTFVFMIASHDGIQELVGVAANAIGMMAEKYLAQKKYIRKQLGIEELWNDAWNSPSVRSRHESVASLKAIWAPEFDKFPTWICPADFCIWLDTPVQLDPSKISGKRRLVGMYSRHAVLSQAKAAQVMMTIPKELRGKGWHRIVDAIQCVPDHPVSPAEIGRDSSPITEVLAQINARRGQGKFRDDLMIAWNSACAVTGLNCAAALRASHVMPWSKSKAHEKLDSQNGIILSANMDALFDRGLISFEDDGSMLISSELSIQDRALLGIPVKLRQQPSQGLRKYLDYHRNIVFKL